MGYEYVLSNPFKIIFSIWTIFPTTSGQNHTTSGSSKVPSGGPQSVHPGNLIRVIAENLFD